MHRENACISEHDYGTGVQNFGILSGFHIPSVHCAALLDVQGASQNFLSVDTVGPPGKLKVIHSVIACSVSQSVLRNQVLQKLPSTVLRSVSLWLI
jgi:hypothetical protein